ncbi:MAG: MFS transporter, partial [Paludibacteraceae bacterium]|nr:MFS transporter [Paludibacteraceae bacterium]
MNALQNKSVSPWWWIPTLYFAEGVPYFLVNNISVLLFAKMGVPNDQLAFFTTLLYFPWFLKGIWSPLVDVVKTKRWWIVAMQVLMTALCVLLALTLPYPDAAAMAEKSTPVGVFWLTLVLFIITAFASATHDIAADGYYMLAHDSGSQARFVGIRSTFYRIAMVFGQGVLVFIAGRIERATGNIPQSWQITLGVTAVVLFVVTLYHIFALPRVEKAEDTEAR